MLTRVIKKVLQIFRVCFDFIGCFSICLTMEVKCILNLFVISDESITVLFSSLNAVDTVSPIRYFYGFPDPLPCFERIQLIFKEMFAKVVPLDFSGKFW